MALLIRGDRPAGRKPPARGGRPAPGRTVRSRLAALAWLPRALRLQAAQADFLLPAHPGLFAQQLPVAGEAARFQLAGGDRGVRRAARLAAVRAVVEAAGGRQ
ncbi:hypothetical protein, partial [Paenibacillus dendritiformis]|uniref:hypothetical protein n=1 Tax=Paenibacillus dendritiformis TaxID=130049 RepID=UPI001C263EDC